MAASLRTTIAEARALVWLMMDQGVFAISNFITNILFARWLLPVDYGMFAVSFTGFTLLTVFHLGAVLEPLLVQSPRVEANRRRSYISILIVAHLVMVGAISVVSGLGYGVARLLHAPETGLAIIGAMIGGSFICTLWITRRLCLVFLSIRVSTLIGLLYMAGVITTTYLLHRYSQVAWFDLWVIMGAWSLLCSAIIFALLYTALDGTEPYTLGELWRLQWQYARYGLAASLCSWGRADGVFLMLAGTAGLEVTAQIRAMLNLANPVAHALLALHTSWLVGFSRDHSRLPKTLLIYCMGASLVVATAAAVYNPLMAWVYGGRYLAGAWLLPLYCLALALNGMESVFSCFMKAVGSLRRGYAPQMIGCLVSLTIGAVLIPHSAEVGFITAMVGSFVTGAILAASLTYTRLAALG